MLDTATRVTERRYKAMKAILSLLHPRSMTDQDRGIFKRSVLDYEADEKSYFNWFNILTSVNRYLPLIAPPKKIMDDVSGLKMGCSVTYVKEGVEYLITKKFDNVSWEIV